MIWYASISALFSRYFLFSNMWHFKILPDVLFTEWTLAFCALIVIFDVVSLMIYWKIQLKYLNKTIWLKIELSAIRTNYLYSISMFCISFIF